MFLRADRIMGAMLIDPSDFAIEDEQADVCC